MLPRIKNSLISKLLLTATTLFICGCGQTPNNKSENPPYGSSRLDHAEKEQKAKEQYLFNGSYKRTDEFMEIYTERDRLAEQRHQDAVSEALKKGEEPPHGKGALRSLITTTYQGVVSESFKATLRKIWNDLETKGFIGFDSSLIARDKEYKFESKSTQGYIDLSTPQYEATFANMAAISVLDPNLYFKYPGVFNLDDTAHYRKIDSDIKSLNYVRILFGLQYQGKILTVVKTEEGKYEAVLADEFRPIPKNASVASKIDSDIPVTQAQIDEWNQVFIDALKEDPFFGKEMSAPADASGAASALAAMKGKSGMDATQFTTNGVSGSQVDLGLPMYVQLKGSVDHSKSTSGMTGLVAYTLGNSVLGVVQSYANSGTGFNSDSRQLESSVIAAHSFGLVFVEGQFGSVSASDVNFKDWSGVRSQVRLGVDTPFGAPFVQLTHRDFGSTSDIAGYVGFEIATTEFKADTYAFSTSLLTKVGNHSVHGASGSIDWTAALTINSGVAFNTNLALGSALESKAAFNLSLDR